MWEHHGTVLWSVEKNSVFNQFDCNELLFIAALKINYSCGMYVSSCEGVVKMIDV